MSELENERTKGGTRVIGQTDRRTADGRTNFGRTYVGRSEGQEGEGAVERTADGRADRREDGCRVG